MPIPKPHKGQKKKKFISSCMADPVMVKEYPDVKQRYAICIGQTKASDDIEEDGSALEASDFSDDGKITAFALLKEFFSNILKRK